MQTFESLMPLRIQCSHEAAQSNEWQCIPESLFNQAGFAGSKSAAGKRPCKGVTRLRHCLPYPCSGCGNILFSKLGYFTIENVRLFSTGNELTLCRNIVTGGAMCKKIILVVSLFFLGVVIPGSASAAQPPLRVAVGGPYPPFAEFDKEGNLFGFDVDMANALCKELKRTCNIHSWVFEDIVPALATGELDFAVAGMANSEERKKFVDFTERYYRSRSVFIERPGSIKEVTPETIKGLRVGTQTGTAQEQFLREHYGGTITIITLESFEEIMAMLKRGELDLILIDGLPGYAYLKSQAGHGLETVGEAIHSKLLPDWACIAVSRKQPGLKDALNKAIQNLRRNGEYGRINRKYFDFTIY